MYECLNETLRVTLLSGIVNGAVAVIYDPPSGPEMSISETCHIVGSSPIFPETQCINTDLSSLLNAHEIIAVPAHEETGNESSIIIKTDALNEAHHSTTNVSDECTCWGSLVVLQDMSYLNDSHAFDQISYKSEENLSDALNDDQEPNEILMDADYSSDRLSTNYIFKKCDKNVSEESNLNDRISSFVDPHHLVSSSQHSIQCGKCFK
ncbi:unnamed protein product [Schistosoma margrebowiei]|uniref:Uncharacterized protein n=1 Tax=Schistosoma margrebowiei TaxID=48269 RepID=A0A183LRI1_9TREM|nr:unnamed protein product [Schistosoma margrebowiei]